MKETIVVTVHVPDNQNALFNDGRRIAEAVQASFMGPLRLVEVRLVVNGQNTYTVVWPVANG